MTVIQIVAVSAGAYVLLLAALFAWLHHLSRLGERQPAEWRLTRIVDGDLRDAA
jgi:hypothetical protein